MGNGAISDTLEGIVARAERANRRENGDYIGADGLLYKAYNDGIVEGLNRGIDLMLYVLIDKHDAPMDDLQQLASELNHAASCVAEGYITWPDINLMLKEYGVTAVLE